MNSQPSTIFQQLEDTADWFLRILKDYEEYSEGHTFPWANYLFKSDSFRRAHIDIVDRRETHKLYMMHICIFPHVNDPSPVFGFDLIAGPSKVTGAFHDFSPISGDTALDSYFRVRTSKQSWSKERELPEWARAIFSTSMVAAGNIQDSDELERLLQFVRLNTLSYLAGVGQKSSNDFTDQQSRYCQFQKMNPHTPRVMKSLGYSEELVHEFIQKCLFPEVPR